MTDIYLDENHDITLLNGDLRLTSSDKEDLTQRVSIALQFLLEEWFLDTTRGVPYTQIIFEAGKSDLETVYSIIRDQIQAIEGVSEITQLDINFDGDSRITLIRTTVNGTTTVEVTI